MNCEIYKNPSQTEPSILGKTVEVFAVLKIFFTMNIHTESKHMVMMSSDVFTKILKFMAPAVEDKWNA